MALKKKCIKTVMLSLIMMAVSLIGFSISIKGLTSSAIGLVRTANAVVAVLPDTQVVIRIINSQGEPIENAQISYRTSSWLDAGSTEANGEVHISIPQEFSILRARAYYKGAYYGIKQNIIENSTIEFKTVKTVVSLKNSMGEPVQGGEIGLYFQSWSDYGVTDENGEAFMELLPSRYRFRMYYAGNYEDIKQDMAVNPEVEFKTSKVTVRLEDTEGNGVQGGFIKYSSYAWQNFGTTDMNGNVTKQLLNGTYKFRIYEDNSYQDRQVDVNGDTVIKFTSTTITPVKTWTLETAVSPSDGGSVVINPAKAEYTDGETVNFQVTPSEGYLFSGYGGQDGAQVINNTLTMNGNKSVDILFEEIDITPVTYTGLAPYPLPNPEIYPDGRKIYVAVSQTNGDGSFEAPFNNIQAGIDIAQPGDTVYVMPGTYPITTRNTTVRDGTAEQRICLVAYDPYNRPVLERSGGYGGEILLIKHPWFLVSGFVMDGQFTSEDYYFKYPSRETSYRNIIAIAHYGGFLAGEPSRELNVYGYNGDHAIVRNCEIKRSSADGIYVSADSVLIENCEVHHCFRGDFEHQSDAHGITGTHVTDLTIRNCDLHHFSGDCIQVDPDIYNRAQTKLWDNVVVENCKLWTSALTENSARFTVGQNPGENGIDTKTFENGTGMTFRPRMTVKNVEVYGWLRNGFINNRSVFNVKYSVDWIIDGVIAYGNEYVFRTRGEWGNAAQGGATLTLKNAVLYDNLNLFRVERLIKNLHIYNCTFSNNTTVMDHRDAPSGSIASYDPATFDMKNCLFLGTRPADAFDPSNLSADASWFQDASSKQFQLGNGSPAIDSGVTLTEVSSDILGVVRPQGAGYDTGAYEKKP